MAKDFFEFIKKRDGVINIKQISKRFPNISKEQFLDGMGKWLEYKGLKQAEKAEALNAMDIWWTVNVLKYQKKKTLFGRSKTNLQGW